MRQINLWVQEALGLLELIKGGGHGGEGVLKAKSHSVVWAE